MTPPFLPISDVDPNVENQRFWDALREGRIELPFCGKCCAFVWYPRAMCPGCHAEVADWRTLPGTGSVYSYTIVGKGAGRWKDAGPYVTAYVQLDSGIDGVDGPRVLTNIVDASTTSDVQQKIKIDSRVTAIIDRDVTRDGVERVLLRFTV